MFRSATFRLTLYYLLIVMFISVGFSAVVYRIGTNDLAFGLHTQTKRLTRDFPVFDNSPYLQPTNDFNDSTHRLLAQLVVLNLLVLIAAGFASNALAKRTLRPIEEAHEQQKRFTADVSHELRTPLTALRMETEVALLDKALSKTELQQILASNIEEITQLDSLITNLLRLTRLDAGELQQQFTALDSAEIVVQAVHQVQKMADRRSITIDIKGQPLAVLGDHENLVQLVVILLDNALKYSPPSSKIAITISERQNEALISVADQGIGIEHQALEHVFDRFYRADSSRNKTQAEGFGLGLSIAKMIADVHQGSITLSSRVGHGTTARLALPLAASRPTHTTKAPTGKASENTKITSSE